MYLPQATHNTISKNKKQNRDYASLLPTLLDFNISFNDIQHIFIHAFLWGFSWKMCTNHIHMDQSHEACLYWRLIKTNCRDTTEMLWNISVRELKPLFTLLGEPSLYLTADTTMLIDTDGDNNDNYNKI